MTVVDENNCLTSDSFLINDNNALNSSVANSSDITCYDYCDGQIFTAVSGGAPNYDANGIPIYTYQWNDVLLQTTPDAIGLCTDNNSNTAQYSCIITDAQGCSDTLYHTLNQPDSLMVSSIITSDYNLQDVRCYAGNDGKVKAIGSGGTNPYSYAWNTQPVQTGENATGLSAGNFSVVLTDANGCMDSAEILLTEPTEMTISVSGTNINCFGIYDGTITASVGVGCGTPFFGIPPSYNYSFSNGFNEQTDTSTAIDLGPGIYTVTATDQNGCIVTSESIFISQPTDLLTLDLYSKDEFCNSNNGEVNSVVVGGTFPYNYIWSNGVNGANASINNLSPGIYFVEVSDANECRVHDTIRVNGSTEVFLPGNISSFDTTICLGSSFILDVAEKLGFSYVWEYNNEILLTTLVDTLNNDQADIVVAPTNYVNVYTLSITDPSCPSGAYEVSATINVDFIDPMPNSDPGIEYGNFPVVLAGESLSLYSDNNTCVEYTWKWSNDTITNSSGSISINDLQKTDWYYLHVKDSEGCLGYDSIYVVVGVKPYDAITPNNDGFNDTWTPLDIQSYDNALVQVFNRWGALVFESQGGNSYQTWDGTNNGKEIAVGTYYYIIDLNNGDAPQTGPITIIR
jgi:gliding motility-associated-like protein